MTKSDCRTSKKNKAGVRKLWRWALAVIAGLILGLNLYRWNASVLAGNVLPMFFGTGTAVVLSGSMSPALEVNDLIIVRKMPRYEVGDIIVFQSGRTMVVHRIVEQEGDWITTRGDANNVSDDPIEISAVKGKVTMRIPFLGAVANLLRRPLAGILLLIGAWVLMERSFQAEKEQDDKDLEQIREEIRRLKEEEKNS